MRILAIETATRRQSIAVLDDARPLVTLEHTGADSQTRWLMPAIVRALSRADLRLADLHGLVLSSGPGSFTGLRTGFATLLGFRQVLGLPLVGVPTLEGLAWNLRGATRPLCPILPAQADHVYWACFRWEGEQLIRLTEDRFGPVSSLSRALQEPMIVLGEGWLLHRQTLLDGMAAGEPPHWEGPSEQMFPSAVSVGLAGLERLKRHELLPRGAAPRYVQRSRAEIEWDAKQSTADMNGWRG